LADIFDQVAVPSAPASGGDIFDQVASTGASNGQTAPADAAPKPQPQSAPSPDYVARAKQDDSAFSSAIDPNEPDYAHPAGATAPLAGVAAHPAATMQEPWESQFNEPVPTRSDALKQGAMIATGAQPVVQVAKAAYNTGKTLYQGAQDVLGQTGEPFDRKRMEVGLTKLIAGGGSAAFMISAPELADVATQAAAGNLLAQQGLKRMIAETTAGAGASAAGGYAAKKAGLTPESQDLIKTALFFFPAIHSLANVQGGMVDGAEGKGVAGSIFAKTDPVTGKPVGGVQFAAGKSPEGVYGAGVKVGSGRMRSIRYGNTEPAPPPDPAQMLDAEQAESGTNAIMRAAQKEQQAKTVVAGGPPPPPPGPPMPSAMASGVISQKIVSDVAQMIHGAPPEQQPQLLLEAHGKLTEYIQKQGRIIGPDGKLQIAETPQQAAKLAQDIINGEVDRQSQAREDAAKQQAEAVKQQQAAAQKAQDDFVKPGPNGEPSPADQQYQRAKTIIEGTTPKPGQHLDETLQRNLNLNIDKPTAHGLIQRYQAETASASLPTVGSKKEPVVEESRATIDTQMAALKRGDINVVMLPEGSKYRPAVPKGSGLTQMAVRGDAPGAGYYIYNPTKLRAATIREAAKAGTHGDLLGHVQPKAEVEAEPNKPAVVVQAQAKDGTPIQDSVVHPERAAAQAEVLQERHPDAEIVVKQPHEVLADRMAAQESERKPEKGETEGDIFDEVSGAQGATEAVPDKGVEKFTKEEKLAEKQAEREAVEEPVHNRSVAAPSTATEPSNEVEKEEFGPIHRQFYHDAKGAIDKLMADKDGEAVAALHHPEVGDIDLVYGKKGTPDKDYEDGYGLAKIAAKHPAILSNLQAFVSSLGIKSRSDNRIVLSDAKGRAVVRLSWDGKQKKWLLTAYMHEESPSAADGGRTGVTNRAEPTPPVDQGADVDQSVAKNEPPSHSKFDKNQRVAFTDRNGIEREGVIRHRGERITRIGNYNVANKNIGEPRPELKPGKVGTMALSELHVAPKELQYKLGTNEHGVTDLLKGRKWNPDYADTLSVWRNPEDGKVYVVNGHHRYALAKANGVKNVNVRMIDAANFAQARTVGALQNIAQGRGTAIDAAKFFRDTGLTVGDLEAKGISMGEATAQNGVALSRLDHRLFDMVVQGKMSQGRGIAIGRETADAATQDAILKLIDKAEKRGTRINDGTVEELARFAQTAPQRQETVESLFGKEERTESTALDKAMVSAYAKRELGAEKRAFGAVASEARAKTLGATGKNRIDAADNAARASSAEQALHVYDKLSVRRGEIDDILNRAAEERASAKPSEVAAIDQRAYEDVRAAVSRALSGGQGSGAEGVQEAPGGGPSRADLEAAGQAGFFARRNPDHPVESLALPGMGDDIQRQKESAAETKAELERQDVERSLTTAKGDVSKAAGEMERHSPLFFGSDANEQGTLFNVSREAWVEASGRDWTENATSAIVKAVPPSGNRHGLAELNASAYYLLRGITSLGQGPDFDAVTLPSWLATDVLAEIRNVADSYESIDPANASTSRSLREIERGLAAQVGKTGQLVIVRGGIDPSLRERVLLEEQIHVAQLDSLPMTTNMLEALTNIGDPYTAMVDALEKIGYKNLKPLRAGMEVSAKLLARMYEDVGVDPATGDQFRTQILAALNEGERNLILSLEEMRDAQRAEGRDLAKGTSEDEAETGPLRSIHRADERASTEATRGEERGRGNDEVSYLHGGLGIAAGALKPLAQVKPVADILAFLGDEADRVAVSRDLHNRLYDMASQDNAAVLRVVQMLKGMPGTAKDQQAIYHHLEDPKSVNLTDTQQEILDDYLTPMIYQAEHDFQVVTEGGVPLENYVHRQVRDRGGMIDRIMERVRDKVPTAGVGGGRLTKTAPAAKHRTMMAIQDVKTGKRQVVSIKGGRVALMRNGQAPEDIGGLRNGMTSVGEEVDERMAPFVKRVTELRDEIAGAKEADRQEQLASIEPRIAELKAQRAALDDVKIRVGQSRPDMFDRGGKAQYSREATFNQRAEITKKLEPLLRREEALKAGTFPMLAKNVAKLNRARAELKGAEAFRDAALNELPPETFANKAWKDKNGGLHTITQATTKEVEANTNVRYYQNAAASVAVNYLAMDKARRAYEFLEEFKRSPEFAAASHSINSPGAIPKGWRTTQLPQFRGYFFEPHIAEVLDMYAKRAAHDPGVLEQVGNFLRTSIFFNPLIHIPNLLNHWIVEKGVSGFANPLNYPTIARAGTKAMNAVIHQNADFLEALDHGAPLQSQQFETKQFADLFFKKMQDELGDPESSKAIELAKALGMSPVRLVKAVYGLSSKATWYTNDIAFLQATYEKQARGMSLKDALNETAKHIPDYRLMTRIFDSKKLGDVMSNHNITMFGAYHYSALKSYGQMAKSLTGFNWTDAGTKNDKGEPTNAAGRTEDEEKLHGLDILAMLALTTFVVYPMIDRLLRAVTGNDKAQMRRAGASTFLYNMEMLAKGEKTPAEVAESVATPAVQTQTAAEMLLNRDLRTGQRLYDPHAPAKKLAGQVGRQLLRSVAPVSQGIDIAEGRTDVKRLMYSMVGVSFPLHGAEKIAAQITAERLSSLPPRREDEIAHAIQRSRALHDAWSGDRSKLNALLRGHDFTAKEKAKIRKDVLMPPIVYEVRGMDYDDALRVYKAANAEQRRQLHPLMSKKLATLIKEGKKPEEILGKDDED